MKSLLFISIIAIALAHLTSALATVCLCKDGVHHDQPDGPSGCHKGYCWSLCKGAGCALTLFQNEWCYTSLDYSQSFNYMKCSTDADCTKHPKAYCAGSCAVSAFGIGAPNFDDYC
ncbi:MAG: hypothetical protein J3R72DRAFT_443008 [Linnemannia gamsii]|nr:MAG: hypothetical protein J3R72DRAFT_443007 [Linnemannia gamsii]KAK3842425.1 MAG: hypothetical protein J3R72DRAFT_443008 [Linnemannia gamsii]